MNDPDSYDMFTSQLVAVQRRLYAYILTLVPSMAQTDDILQSTNLVLLRKRKEFVAGTEFGAWACRVAYFEVLAYRKCQQRERGRIFFTDETLLSDLAGEARDRYIRRDDTMLARLDYCLAKLSSSHREILRLRYREGLSSEQISAKLGRSANSARQLLYRIRTQLLACLQRKEGLQEST